LQAIRNPRRASVRVLAGHARHPPATLSLARLRSRRRFPVSHPPTDPARVADRTAPAGPCVGYQRWHRLLFAHWTVPAAAVQARLPPGLFVDTFAGEAYLGLVPFFMQRIRPRGLPPVPGISWFLEFNLRTYVFDEHGRPGVWFYSLDCNQALAVAVARRWFHLPYEHATMRASMDGDTCDFTSRRRDASAPADRFTWTVPAPAGNPAPVGSLEFFLAERYRFFTVRRDGAIVTACVRHAPYRLHAATATRWSTTVAGLAGFNPGGPPVSVLAADTVDVAIHPLRPLAGLPSA
jgi:uncharacterized protein YqjF (DUF2071 family)